MADTNDILQKLGGANRNGHTPVDDVEADAIDEPHPAAEPQLSLSNQLQMNMSNKPDMGKKLEEILANTHKPSPDLPDK